MQKFARNFIKLGFLVVSLSRFTGLCLSEDSTSLPASWPQHSVQVKVSNKQLLAEGVAPQILDIGSLQTGKNYVLRIPYVNLLGKPAKIVDIATSCGCMVAANGQELVAENETSTFLILVKPQSQAGDYRKTITLNSDPVSQMKLLVRGTFVAPVELLNNKQQVDDVTSRFDLRFRMNDSERIGKSVPSKIAIQSLTGYLEFEKTALQERADELVVSCEIPNESRKYARSAGLVVEQLRLVDAISGLHLCDFEFRIISDARFLLRPSVARCVKENDLWKCQLLVFGNWSDKTANPETVCVRDNGAILDEVTVSVLAANSRVAKFEVCFPNKPIADKGKLALTFADGGQVCSLGDFQFEGE